MATKAGRIVLYGASGYTGAIAAEALVERGLRPVLAGRDINKLTRLAERLGGLEVAVADGATNPRALHHLVGPGDVVIGAAGPFATVGEVAVEAATEAGCVYFDCTGEPPFVQKVFERYGPRASRTGAVLVPAFGYDYIPGNAAATVALQQAGEAATRVDIGYFLTGGSRVAATPGSIDSVAGAITEPTFAWRGGIVAERGAARMRKFIVNGRRRPGLSIGSTEHFALPRENPRLKEVNVYLGWFGPGTRVAHLTSPMMPLLEDRPRIKARVIANIKLGLRAMTVDPDGEEGQQSRSHIVAEAFNSAGTMLAEVHLVGAGPQAFTGRILAWGAERALAGDIRGPGAVGPVGAAGLAPLLDGCKDAGIQQLEPLIAV